MPDEVDINDVDVWFQDETRIGQQGSTTRLWAKKGTRPRAIIPFLESLQTSAQSLEQRLCIRPCSVVKFVHASVATPKISS